MVVVIPLYFKAAPSPRSAAVISFSDEPSYVFDPNFKLYGFFKESGCVPVIVIPVVVPVTDTVPAPVIVFFPTDTV